MWLASRGFRVTAVDFSAEALAKTGRLACEAGVGVNCLQLDLEAASLDLGREVYDLVCGFYFLHRPLFPMLREGVKRGGLIVYKTYTIARLAMGGRPRNPAHLLEPGELPRLLEGFQTLAYREDAAGAAGIVAQKPAGVFARREQRA